MFTECNEQNNDIQLWKTLEDASKEVGYEYFDIEDILYT